jgi:adenine-specific DNA-methyltransferase
MAKKVYNNWDREELIKEIDQLKKRKKYGIVWEEKLEDVVEQCKRELPVLEEVKSKEIIASPDKPINLLIEGDNYHALSVLNYTHEKSIDLIFIDPPYNLGNGDFIYNDNIVDSEDAYRHSKWLSFIDKRLRLAHKLLKYTGAIFITIDDNEAAHLKVLCDEIFQPQNFVAQISWQKKFSPQNDATYFSDMHDTILVYAKRAKAKKADQQCFNINGLTRTDEANARYSNPDNDPRLDWASSDCTVKSYSKEYDYPIETPSGRVVNPPESRCWFTSKVRMQALIDDNRIWFGADGSNVPRLKSFLSEVKEVITPTTWWTHQEAGHNQEAKQELKEILPDVKKVFDTPKPVRLIKRILELAIPTDRQAIILDFFAGSGTTAHAVMEFNELVKTNHQFIVCTNNENNIASTICYPRIKRVIEGYNYEGNMETVLFEEKLTLNKLKFFQKIYDDYQNVREINKEKYDGLKGELKDNTIRLVGTKKNIKAKPGLGGNLKYFKTSFVPAEPTDKNKTALTRKATQMLCVKEDTFDEIKSNEQYSIFRNKKRYTGIIFDYMAIDKFKKEISKIEGKFSVYVFSLGYDTFDEEFDDMKKKVKLSPIPEAILRVYRRIFK